MIKFSEIKEYITDCKNIVRQVKIYGDKLKFETWIYSGILKISDAFLLDTPDMRFEVVKYNIKLGPTRYRLVLNRKPVFMEYPKDIQSFNRLVAPVIFMACARKYKEKGKHK